MFSYWYLLPRSWPKLQALNIGRSLDPKISTANLRRCIRYMHPFPSLPRSLADSLARENVTNHYELPKRRSKDDVIGKRPCRPAAALWHLERKQT